MNYRPLGRTGMMVSPLCLGNMMFGAWGNADHDDATRIIHRALDHGINFVDTADVYSAGESEVITGQALAGSRRDGVILATKAHFPVDGGPFSTERTPNAWGNSRRHILRACEDSLRRLGTDWIDLYQMHRPDPNVPLDETLSALTDLVHQGKIRAFGCSTFPAEMIVEGEWIADRRGLMTFATEQPPYSIFVRGMERDLFPVAQRFNLGVLVWSPLNGSWLTGRYRKGHDVDFSVGRAARMPARFDPTDPVNQRKFDLVDELIALADQQDLKLTHLALAFALEHPAVTSAIIGPRTMDQLEDVLGPRMSAFRPTCSTASMSSSAPVPTSAPGNEGGSRLTWPRRHHDGARDTPGPGEGRAAGAASRKPFGGVRAAPDRAIFGMPSTERSHALDHVVVVLFENRSLDNVLGHLYGPEDGKTFDGVIGKNLSNPIPSWAEHGAERKAVPYTVATDMDSPNPDSGEEHFHTNTQLYNTLDEHNRFKIGDAATSPWNAPPPGTTPTMDGFVTDYISTFTGEVGRQPTYDEYAQIMTGYTPEQLPVLNGIARDFGVFDHWFCEVPSQTFMNRSFWTAATSSGLVVNSPMTKWFAENDAETIFERLEAHGRTWKVYVAEPMALSFTGMIHFPRLKDRLATHFVPFAEFERDAAAGTLPDFSLIEPNMIAGHGDYHPAFGRSFSDTVDLAMDNPSSTLSGEAFLARVFDAYRSATSETGTNVWNTALLVGWDEPGGTYDHVPPGPVPPPDPSAPPGECDFSFDRSGYRVPAIVVSPWVAPGSVYNDEYRHTSLIATLRKAWGLGEAFTQRDASARTFDHVFLLATPRDPNTWANVEARPLPAWMMDPEIVGRALSTLGKGMGPGLIAKAREMGLQLPPELDDPGAALTPGLILPFLRNIAGHFFPLLAGTPNNPD